MDEARIHRLSWDKLTKRKDVGGLGFRDFSCFNDAMIAKQCWRIMLNPSDLWVRVIKGIYFPNCTFLEALKGARVSWAWSSLLEGRNLLLKGLIWRVGDGRSIDFWKDPWVSNLVNFKLAVRDSVSVFENAKVADFIVGGRWDCVKLAIVVSFEELNEIKKVPIFVYGSRNKITWAAAKNGSYSVKTGYHLARSFLAENMSLKPSSSSSFPSGVWSSLWKGRCEYVFQGTHVNSLASINVVEAAFLQFWSVAVADRSPAVSLGSMGFTAADKWVLPPKGVIKVNTEVAFDQPSGRAGFGAIAHSWDRAVVGGVAFRSVAPSSFGAEALAVLKGAAGDWKGDSVVEDFRVVAQELQSVSFSWVRRSGNLAVNWLARSASKGMCPIGWVSMPPSPLASILESNFPQTVVGSG
ncbi:reverse transcriptase [Senna tora]|uniref:Reverse transcriptase n=1 Tax=Senna tora TaxID=362788 RepID=A0A834T202_9FABA|nr:reverse transcriptase [Senna tora]